VGAGQNGRRAVCGISGFTSIPPARLVWDEFLNIAGGCGDRLVYHYVQSGDAGRRPASCWASSARPSCGRLRARMSPRGRVVLSRLTILALPDRAPRSPSAPLSSSGSAYTVPLSANPWSRADRVLPIMNATFFRRELRARCGRSNPATRSLRDLASPSLCQQPSPCTANRCRFFLGDRFSPPPCTAVSAPGLRLAGAPSVIGGAGGASWSAAIRGWA